MYPNPPPGYLKNVPSLSQPMRELVNVEAELEGDAEPPDPSGAARRIIKSELGKICGEIRAQSPREKVRMPSVLPTDPAQDQE